MTNFIYDNTDLPGDKEDARPPSGPSNQRLVAAEWNTTIQAALDIKGAIRAERVHVRDYGAVGDGVTDDAGAIQNAINAAAAAKKPLWFEALTYLVNTELSADTLHGLELKGSGSANAGRTIIKAGASIRSVLVMKSSYTHIHGICFDANRNASYALFIEGGSFNKFENCLFQKAKKDGVNLSVIGVNDNNIFTDSWSCDNGRIYCTAGMAATFANYQVTAATGTVACTSGDEHLVGTGTHFTQMGIRSGDFIRVGTGAGSDQFLQISTVVDDTHITVGVRKVPAANLSGQGFAVAVGNGYTEVRHNDNNISKISGGLWRLNAGAGMMFNGLYGPKVEHPQLDLQGFYGICVGTTDQEVVYATVIDHPYFEGNLAAPILFGTAIGIDVIQPQYGFGVTPLYHIGYSAQNIGTWHDYDGLKPIGAAQSTIPTTKSASTFTIDGQLFTRGEVQVVTAGTAINSAPTLLLLSLSAPTVMTATPTIVDGTTDGQEITLHNYAAGDPLILRDEALLPGSKLRLLSKSLVLQYKDTLRLHWINGQWEQAGHKTSLHPDVNVLDFGADPTGVLDSSPAFTAAIASFAPSGDSRAGTVIVPKGDYRLSSNVSLKKAVWIKGSQGASGYPTSLIKPDVGVTAFTMERYNTPTGTSDGGAADTATISNLLIQPPAKAVDWTTSHSYSLGAKTRTGTGVGEDWRRHYVATTGGVSSSSGNGPRSLGNDKILVYKTQTGNFTRGLYVSGGTSGASGIIIADTDNGTTGTLRLTSVYGTFVNNEALTDTGTGVAVANGGSTAATDDELDGSVRWKYIGPGAGIKIRANTCTVRDVWVYNTSGCGIHIEAQDLECPNEVANANGWHLDNVHIWFSDGHGLFLNGSDANGGSYSHGTLYGNGSPGLNGDTGDEDFTGIGYAVYESSFLGNQFFGLQMGSSGVGSIYSNAVGGGSTFVGCYQEGSGGGENKCQNSCVIVGGGLSASLFSTDSSPVCIGPISTSRGFICKLSGWGGAPWRASVHSKLGNRRYNGSNLYEVITAGITASSGGPTGTGADIVDGTTHWAFVHALTNDGFVYFGSADPQYKNYITVIGPDDVNKGDYLYHTFRDSTNGLTSAYATQYGISGPNAPAGDNGSGICHASRASVLNDGVIKMKIPAGKPVADEMWIGGVHFSTGTAAPANHTWNKGDKVFYRDSAVTPGGAEGLICTTAGTAGTYTGGRTATANGTTTITISGAAFTALTDQHDFKIGDVLTINGTTSKVVSDSENGLTLVMGSSITTGSGLAITFSNPVWKNFGSIAA